MTSWGLRGTQIRDDDGMGQHVATYMRDEADGRLIASAPELLEIVRYFLSQHPIIAPIGTLYEMTEQARDVLLYIDDGHGSR